MGSSVIEIGKLAADCIANSGELLDHHQAHGLLAYSTLMVAMSMNQLLGCTTPLTLGLIARGPTSWAIHRNGASSTMRACSLASAASRAVASKDVRASAISWSISA